MARSQKTGKANRENYIYYGIDGSKTTLTPGKDGVTETDIEMLHALDDSEFNNNRRNESGQLRFSTLNNASDSESLDETIEPADHSESQLDKIIFREECYELSEALRSLQPQQLDLIIVIYFKGRKVVDIAREQGVSHVAILDRLKRIHRKIEKILNQPLT